MQAAQTFDELSRVETCSSLTELLVLAQVVEQLSSVQEVHHKIQFCRRLESVMQLDYERTVDFLQYVSLGYTNQSVKRLAMITSHRARDDWHFMSASLLTLSLDEEVSFCDHVFLELLHGIVVFGAISFD